MNKKLKVLMPLPLKDFDPTEAGVSFKILQENNVEIIIATPNGEIASCDQKMYLGKDLGPFRSLLMADKNGRDAFKFMYNSWEFNHPIAYSAIDVNQFDGIVLPGGHDKGMREYLESESLQKIVLKFDEQKKIIGAICHGVIVLARTKDQSGKSILNKRHVTSLLKVQELIAFNMTRIYLGDYYLTYPITVEDEVLSVLNSPAQFHHGKFGKSYLTVGLIKKDTPKKLEDGFVVIDQNLITARWPGDAHRFANEFIKLLHKGRDE